MKTTTVELSKAFNEIELHCLADDHIGDDQANIEVIKERISTIEDTPNAYCVMLGDSINNALANSKSDVYSAHLHPSEQIRYVAELYAPIRDKILAILPGNHETRSWRAAGIDPTRMIALELGLVNKYTDEPLLMFLRFGADSRRSSEGRPVSYMIYLNHGSGGGRRVGAKANRVEDLAGIVDADLYCVGHTHMPITFKKDYFRTTPSTSSVQQVTKTFVNTAAALNYGSYGSQMGFSPSCKDNPVIYLNGQKKDIRVMV